MKKNGSDSKRVHGKTLLNVDISLPCLLEQIKIVNFLSIINDKINNCQLQIEKM
ncbi:restriction endonuclease subunit S [Flavobacterium branchiarum]|uniref:Restriction endonuclease subunit S n=1 Tax=Flavobacterium branchiarum TaxID=1114870 RepID=A0ABV5FK45_9FLAO